MSDDIEPFDDQPDPEPQPAVESAEAVVMIDYRGSESNSRLAARAENEKRGRPREMAIERPPPHQIAPLVIGSHVMLYAGLNPVRKAAWAIVRDLAPVEAFVERGDIVPDAEIPKHAEERAALALRTYCPDGLAALVQAEATRDGGPRKVVVDALARQRALVQVRLDAQAAKTN